jgi:hypothetical protein
VGKAKTIEKLKTLFHKPGVNKDDWNKVHNNLLVLADYVIAHTETHNLPMVITSIIRPKIPGVSKTDIHSTGRAFDLSVIGWSKEDIQFLVDAINEAFTIGAISLRDHQEREAIFEGAEFDKNGDQTKWPHFHFQVRA